MGSPSSLERTRLPVRLHPFRRLSSPPFSRRVACVGFIDRRTERKQLSGLPACVESDCQTVVFALMTKDAVDRRVEGLV